MIYKPGEKESFTQFTQQIFSEGIQSASHESCSGEQNRQSPCFHGVYNLEGRH